MLTKRKPTRTHTIYIIAKYHEYRDFNLGTQSACRLDVQPPSIATIKLTRAEYEDFLINHSRAYIDAYVFDDAKQARAAWKAAFIAFGTELLQALSSTPATPSTLEFTQNLSKQVADLQRAK